MPNIIRIENVFRPVGHNVNPVTANESSPLVLKSLLIGIHCFRKSRYFWSIFGIFTSMIYGHLIYWCGLYCGHMVSVIVFNELNNSSVNNLADKYCLLYRELAITHIKLISFTLSAYQR